MSSSRPWGPDPVFDVRLQWKCPVCGLDAQIQAHLDVEGSVDDSATSLCEWVTIHVETHQMLLVGKTEQYLNEHTEPGPTAHP